MRTMVLCAGLVAGISAFAFAGDVWAADGPADVTGEAVTVSRDAPVSGNQAASGNATVAPAADQVPPVGAASALPVAQDTSLPTGEAAATASGTPTDTPTTPALAATPAAQCELHVWPTENYIGIQTGLLSGFGLLGSLADNAAHAGKVRSVKDLMREYLGPEIQLQELQKIGVQKTLGISGAYAIVVEETIPSNEDVRNSPALKARMTDMNARLKDGRRMLDAKSSCYAELISTQIFYHKAMMYGSNLFVGWIYREYEGGKVKAQGRGQVKTPLEEFPPKTPDKIAIAKAELRDAYAQNFPEYVAKKVKR